MGGDDAGRSRRAKRAAATAVVAAAGLGFGVAALGLGAAAFAAGEWRHRRDGRRIENIIKLPEYYDIFGVALIH